ncbi:MAG: formate acetyltransferase [Desulfobacteraceae bacterium]|nr:formate acetyltransferase [Desulfobacteraceae bacterium]
MLNQGRSVNTQLNHLLVLSKPPFRTGRKGKGLLNIATAAALRIMAFQFNFRPSLRPYLKSRDGWINFSIGITTREKSVAQAIIFNNGRVRVTGSIPDTADAVLEFANEASLVEMARGTPDDILNMILKNRLVSRGNLSHVQVFNYYISLIMGRVHQKRLDRAHREDVRSRRASSPKADPGLAAGLAKRRNYRIKGEQGADPGVKYLGDAYLSACTIDDFPRLASFLDIHFTTRPEVCPERPMLLTGWFRENGFETDKNGKPWFPEMRQALAFKYLMENRKPIIRENDLLAGTTTSKRVGVTVFPDGHASMFWGELNSANKRVLNPCACTKETAEILHSQVFPFWVDRTFREYVRTRHGYPLCQELDDRFVAYFVWKSVGISHTIPNFKRLLEKGTLGIIKDIEEKLETWGLEKDRQGSLRAMAITLGGVNAYGAKLAKEATRLARKAHGNRKKELLRLGEICARVPMYPADSLDEAVNAVWIMWTAIHMENSNTGTSLGRLDQLFQPYFERDMAGLATREEREEGIRRAIELAGCLIMGLTDHVPMLPDIANYLFGGASSTQAITVGGITPQGEDGVNDMTYIFLKATELLGVRDANLNARFHVEINSDAYLKRLCEVNIITAATPIMQGDKAVIASLNQHGYPLEAVNDWAATGCVEPTLQGRHFSHTGSILLNMVAAMELALNNGCHPLMNFCQGPGPATGSIENNDFKTFDDFFDAWAAQQRFLIDRAVDLNNLLGEAHQKIRPTPLLSALIDGAIESGRDVLRGGARYNSSGSSNIGLVDVTDSLLVIEQLVFGEAKIPFKRLKKAVDTDFRDDPALHAMVGTKVGLFGSGDAMAVAMANRVAKVVHDAYRARTNYRGGRYSAGFWSMSQHVAYGSLSGTLPSGRLKGMPFTPGLTPAPNASRNFLDNIAGVAGLEPTHMDNNIAFNVKLTPLENESREQMVNTMAAYVKSYFMLGGMQMQFNVVSSDTLRDAMANPENYRNLMVRISGYNAYFVTLNRTIQEELIRRAEYAL